MVPCQFHAAAAVSVFMFLGFLRVPLTSVASRGSNGYDFVDEVILMTDATWQHHTEDHTVVLLYASWCGHCKRLLPTYNRLAKQLENGNVPVKMAALEASEQQSNPAMPITKGFPTLVWVHKHKIVAKYEGDRSMESLLFFIETILSTSEEEINRQKQKMQELVNSHLQERERVIKERERMEAEAAIVFAEKVIGLTDKNFIPYTTGKDALVMVYADWCAQCGSLKPEWVKLAEDPGVFGLHAFSLNNSEWTVFPGSSLVEGLPTILYLRNSVVVALYEEGRRRTADALRHWAREVNNMSPEAVGRAISAMHSLGRQREQHREKALQEAAARDNASVQNFETRITEITVENYEELTADGTVAIMVYAEWYDVCKGMKPIWVYLSQVQVAKDLLVAKMVDTEASKSCIKRYVDEYPTFVYLKHGRVVERLSGPLPYAVLSEAAAAAAALTRDQSREKEMVTNRKVEQGKEEDRRIQQQMIREKNKLRDEEIRKLKREKRKNKIAK